MVEVEIDGEKIKAEEGRPLLEVALDAGKPIPHFCYHKKLSVTASCRMCLVEVEKAPRLMPACATQVTDGMVVHTDTEKVAAARKAVMEFLLINHPLDCPVCDQGGECRLQDYSMAYGAGASRYREEKRVVLVKDAGPLVSMQGMSRCIQCTRCIRFGEEIAGRAELGMVQRGERAEVTTFPGKKIDSELSGNLIDVCPVGALTSLPFRYKARGWELASHRGVSPHDGLGSNLNVQTLRGKVMRVLPAENEAVNECWLSDRDRFSYEALDTPERLTVPMVKQDNRWIETDWETALSYVAHGLTSIRRDHGAMSLAALVSPQATLEECYLLQKLMRGMGSEKIEYRLAQSDFSLDGKVAPWLGMPVADIETLDHILVIGSFLRQEAPLLATRFRKAAQRGAQIGMVHALDDDWLMPVAARLVASPDKWLTMLAGIMEVIAHKKGVPLPDGFKDVVTILRAKMVLDGSADDPNGWGASMEKIADSLLADGKKAVFLGALALRHEQASLLHRAAEWIAAQTGAVLGCLTEGANATGAMLAGACPGTASGVSMNDIASDSSKAFLLLHTEPELEAANPPRMMAALKQAEMVVAISPFKQSMDYADVLLPVAAFAETAGTFISFEGRVQSFGAAAAPAGQARPAWKVLRVLGNFLELDGFGYDSADDIRQECLAGRRPEMVLNNISGEAPLFVSQEAASCRRVADVPLYFSDVLVRRAPSLQKTAAAKSPVVYLPETLFDKLELADGEKVRVVQPDGETVLPAYRDKTLAAGTVRLATGHAATAMLGPLDGEIRVERI